MFGPKYIYLPYVNDAGLLFISDALFFIKPVLTDKTMSPDKNEVFIRLLRDKVQVKRQDYMIRINFNKLKTRHVLYAGIYKRNNKNEKITKAESTLVHYLLIKYGFKDTFKKLLGCVPKVCLIKEAELNFDAGKHTVYTSIGTAPRRTYIGNKKAYIGPEMALMFNNKDVSDLTATIACNFFYVVDHFPTMQIADLENKDRWKFHLGELILGRQKISNTFSQVSDHMKSLENYVETYMINKLRREFGTTLGVDFSKDGFFVILIIIMQRFHKWTIAAEEISSNCYDKRLEISYYILFEILKSINEFSFFLESADPETLNMKKIRTRLDQKLTLAKIFAINKANTSCVPVTYSGDNQYMKITSSMELQLNVKSTSPKSKTRSGAMPDSTTLLHQTQLIGGTLNAITKSRLAPLKYMNIFAPYDPVTRTIIPTKEMQRDTERLRKVLLKTVRKSNTDKIPKEFNIYNTDN
jgi:hypothetical protein